MTATHTKTARKPWNSAPAIEIDDDLLIIPAGASSKAAAGSYEITPQGQANFPTLERRLGAAAAIAELVAMGQAHLVKADEMADPKLARIDEKLKALPPAARRATQGRPQRSLSLRQRAEVQEVPRRGPLAAIVRMSRRIGARA